MLETPETVLVIGAGAREHALVWKLALSEGLGRILCAPWNVGISEECLPNGRQVEVFPNISATNLTGLRDLAVKEKVDLTVVGPEVPLANGIVDLFQKASLTIFGPNRKAAQFEASKVFSQRFAFNHDLPFAQGTFAGDALSARLQVRALQGRCVIKADGLAAGKGAFVCQSVTDAEKVIEKLFVHSELGEAGERVVIQELLEGEELSLQILCDGTNWRLLPTAKDHKSLLEQGLGPNTGGMGTYSPHFGVTTAEAESIARSIMEPFLVGCRKEEIDFRGVLYPGIMMTKNGPRVLEFNCRFGDPETQVILPRLKGNFAKLLFACATGRLADAEFSVDESLHSVCVVLAAPGYPDSPRLGRPVSIGAFPESSTCKVFHAGTGLKDSRVVSTGGRILGVTAWDRSLQVAQARAYEAMSYVHIEGGYQFRGDIGGTRAK